MAQFINLPQSARGRLSDVLGQEIGGGLANFTGNYFASKALDRVLNDPAMKNADLSERQSKLQAALQPYGQYGENIFQKRLQIEQQKEQDRVTKGRNRAENKFLSGQELTPEEEELVRPELRISYLKAQQPKGGLSGQPVPPEIQQAIPKVLNANRNASADDLAMAFDQAGIPRAYSNSYIENRRQETKPVFEPTSEKLEAERVSKIADEISKEYQSAQNEDLRLDRMQELDKKGNLTTPLMNKTLDFLGLPLGVLGNPDSEEFSKLESDFVRDVSKIFPGQIRVFEIQSYLRTVPGLANSPEGRKSIIRNRKLLNEAKKVKYDEYKKILKENDGKKPRNLDVLLEERTAPRINEIGEKFREGIEDSLEKQLPKMKMYDKEGRAYEIPSHLIPQAEQQGLMFR